MDVMRVDWTEIPDDVIEEIVTVMIKPLKDESKQRRLFRGTVDDDKPTVFKQLIYGYFSLLLTNKQFSRVTQRIDLDWLELLGLVRLSYATFRVNIQWQILQDIALLDETRQLALSRSDVPYMPDEAKKLIKTLTLYDSSLPILRHDIDRFMGSHNIVYRTVKTGKIYKGFVGVRKLNSMKIECKTLAKQFKATIKRHQVVHKKRGALLRELKVYSDKVYERRRAKRQDFICGTYG